MSDNLKHSYQKYKDSMAEWIKFLGLPKTEPERSEVENILILSQEELRILPQRRIFEYAFMLSQYALFLQQKTNECQSFLGWSQNNIGQFVGEDRSKLQMWTKNIKLRLTQILYLSKKIETMIQCLSNLGRITNN